MTQWRTHPKLVGKFHPDYPDDVQVVIHDGGPRLTRHRPELVWVRVRACDGSVFTGTVLNQPKQLDSVQEGSTITFLAPDGGPHPVMATEKYLRERPDWIVHPCDRCGLTELFDAPSDLMRVVFPHMREGEIFVSFTAFCGACGGVQVVEHTIRALTSPAEQMEAPSGLVPSPAGLASHQPGNATIRRVVALPGRSQLAESQKKWWQFWR